MQVEQKEVRRKGKVVGVASFEEFENIEEAIAFMGEDTVLDLINTQHGTNARNKIRSDAAGSMSKKALHDAAMLEIINDPSLIAEIAGVPEKLEAAIISISERIKADKEAEASAAADVVVDADEDDEAL